MTWRPREPMAREPITDEQVPTSLDGEEVKERCVCVFFFRWSSGTEGASSIFYWLWVFKHASEPWNFYGLILGLHLQCEGWRVRDFWVLKGCSGKRQETWRKSQEAMDSMTFLHLFAIFFESVDPQFQPKILLDPKFRRLKRCKSMQCFTAISRRRSTSAVVVWSRRFVTGSHAAELMRWWKMMKVSCQIKEDQVTTTFICLLQGMQMNDQ